MIYLFLNSPTVGGAEISAIEQARLTFKSNELTFCTPEIKDRVKSDIVDYIKNQFPEAKIFKYPFQKQLFEVSRSSFSSLLFSIFFVPVAVFRILKFFSVIKISSDDIIWSNGNKSSILLLLALSFQSNWKGKMIWHWRDYPDPSIMLKVAYYLVKRLKHLNILMLANSLSVRDSLTKWIGALCNIDYVYNPTGLLNFKPVQKVETIALASMFAPWKGQHEILFSLFLIKNELQKLGIKKVLIFGEQIYQTKGEHRGYDLQLKNIVQRLKLDDFVTFCGRNKTEVIMQETDLLIHSSIRPEPFGRVLIEAMASGVPVLSTAIGGAREVIGANNERGWSYHPYHPTDLLRQIEQISRLDERDKLESARAWAHQLNHNIPTRLKSLFF